MKKRVLVILIFFFTFFISINVKAEDNPRMVIDKKPNALLSSSQFQVIGSINSKSLEDSSGNLTCPAVYIGWNNQGIGQQGATSMRSYVASFEQTLNTDNRDTATITNRSITKDSLVCNYKFDGPSYDDYEFSIHYNKTADQNSNKTKLKDCLYYNQNKNSPYYQSVESYLAFTIYTDGTVGGAVGFGAYSAYTVSYEGGNLKDCPAYISTKKASTLQLTPSTIATDWKNELGDIKDAEQQMKGSAYYVAYNSATAPKIIVRKENGEYKFYMQTEDNSNALYNATKTTPITVNGINEFTSDFDSKDPSKYPTWINLAVDGKTYTISNTKDQSAKVNYICLEQINSIYTPGENPEATCETLFGSDFLNFLNSNVITIVRLGIPLLLILFTTFDFAKVVFVDDKEGIQKAGKRFGKRIVAAILIYLIPAILIFLVKIIGADKVDECSDFLDSLETEQTE